MSGPNKEAVFARMGYEPHPTQRKFHDSSARFKVPVCGRRYGKSLMAAREVEPELFVPDRKYWICGPCVDENTEILSERGWLYRDEILVGDQVLTLNNRGSAEWEPVLKVNKYEGSHRMIRIQQRGHDSLTTPHHRWLVGYVTHNTGGKGPRTLGYRFTTTEEMTKPNEFVLGGAQVSNLPSHPKYEDGFVELVGWYWTEGTDQQSGWGLWITQNEGPDSDRIRSAARSVFGEPYDHTDHSKRVSYPSWSDWKPIPGNEECGRFGFNIYAGKLIREAAPDKIVSPEFISSLTKSQLELFIATSVRADGHERSRGSKGTERVVVQTRRDRLSSLQMACQLAGYQTKLHFAKSNRRFVLSIFERSKMWLGTKQNQRNREEVAYRGTVWCPTTPNGTWLARRNGTVYFTGNTFDLSEKEFRVVWQDLIVGQNLGRDKRVKKAYNKAQGNMYIQFPWRTLIEVRSANHPEYLVGEALHGIIMSEAAKQGRETWERYVRPALNDFKGWAIFPTTPEGRNWLYELWKLGIDPDFPEYAGWRFPSWENSFVYPGGKLDEEIELIRRTVSREYFAQEIEADFSSFVGKVFEEFDEQTHVQRHEFRPEWPNYIGFDFGFADPFAAFEFQIAPDDTIYVWREHYESHRTLPEHVEKMKNREQPEGYRIDCGFGDPADPEAILYLNQHLCPTLGDPECKRNWRESVDLMKGFMESKRYVGEVDEFGTPEYKPGFFVDPSCKNAIAELNEYRTKDNPSGSAKVPQISRTVSDHLVDAARYALMHLYKLGAQHHLSDIYAPGSGRNPFERKKMEPESALASVTGGSGVGGGGEFFDMGMEF